MQWRNDLVRRAVNALEQVGYDCKSPSRNKQDLDILAWRRGEASAIRVKCPGRNQSRPHIYKKCLGQSVHMIFQNQNGHWYLVPHDELVRIVGETTNWLSTKSWRETGEYSSGSPSSALLDRLLPFALNLSV